MKLKLELQMKEVEEEMKKNKKTEIEKRRYVTINLDVTIKSFLTFFKKHKKFSERSREVPSIY